MILQNEDMGFPKYASPAEKEWIKKRRIIIIKKG